MTVAFGVVVLAPSSARTYLAAIAATGSAFGLPAGSAGLRSPGEPPWAHTSS
jgi:hypothetical protein